MMQQCDVCGARRTYLAYRDGFELCEGCKDTYDEDPTCFDDYDCSCAKMVRDEEE